MKFLIATLFILVSSTAAAFNVEGTAAMSSTAYDNDAGETEAGLSARLRARHYGSKEDGHGFFYGGDFPGIHPIAGTLFGGYGLSSDGPWAFEIAGGVYRSSIFGTGITFIAGVSRDLNDDFSISFPLMLMHVLSLNPSIIWRF